MLGLADHHLAYLRQLLAQYPTVEQAIVYGSRARGDHRPSADVDIALKGMAIERVSNYIYNILNEESPMIYFFDVVDYENISSLELKAHIDREGVIIYSK